MRRRRLAAVAAAAGLLIAGCGGGDDDDGGSSGGSAPAVETTPSDTTAKVSKAQLDRDATLRYGFYISLSSFDPHLANGSQDNTYLFPVYDRLVHTSPNAEPEPGLATSWTFAEDGSYLEMKLRKGVTFHDGEPFDAEAVQANIERAKTHPKSALTTTLEHVTKVDVVDDFTVRIHTAYPDAALPLTLSDRAGTMISPAAFDDPDLGTKPVGAGAYRVTEYIPNDRAVYERYEDYWDAENVHLGGIELKTMVNETTRLNALRSGEIDAAEIETSQVELAEEADLNVTTGYDVSFGLLQFNSERREEFADERVRQAINHAIDREAIVQGIFLGRARAAVQPFLEGSNGYSPDVPDDYFEYDPEEAKRLLDEAGYADGFSFEILTTATPQRLRTCEAIQQNLAEVGIDVSIRQVESAGPFLDAVYTQKSADAWMLAWGGRPDPWLTADLLYDKDSFNNPSNLSSPRVEKLLDRAASTFEPAKRTKVLEDLSKAIVEEVLDVVVLYFPEKIGAYNDRVVGMDIWEVGRPEFRGMGMKQE